MAAIGTPAATEMMSFEGSMAGAISMSTLSSACGFTHSTTTSASRAAVRLSLATRMPYASSSSFFFSARRTVAVTLSFDRPARSSPLMMALAMLPAPMNVMRRSITSRLPDPAGREEDRAGAEAATPAPQGLRHWPPLLR